MPGIHRPDRQPGTREEEALLFEDTGTDPTDVGEIRRNGSALKAKDGTGVFDLRSGSGISEATHETLDTLVHEIAEDSYEEIVRDGNGRFQFYRVWTDNTKVTKIREIEVTRDGNQRCASIITRQYDGAGVLKESLSKTLNRDGNGRFSNFDPITFS